MRTEKEIKAAIARLNKSIQRSRKLHDQQTDPDLAKCFLREIVRSKEKRDALAWALEEAGSE